MPRAKRFTSLLIPCFTPCCCRFVLSPPPSSRFPSIKSNTSATTTHRQEHCPNAADACFCPPDPTSLRTVARVVLLDQETNDYYRNVDSSPPCADCSNIVLCLRSGSRTARRLLISAKSASFLRRGSQRVKPLSKGIKPQLYGQQILRMTADILGPIIVAYRNPACARSFDTWQ